MPQPLLESFGGEGGISKVLVLFWIEVRWHSHHLLGWPHEAATAIPSSARMTPRGGAGNSKLVLLDPAGGAGISKLVGQRVSGDPGISELVGQKMSGDPGISKVVPVL